VALGSLELGSLNGLEVPVVDQAGFEVFQDLSFEFLCSLMELQHLLPGHQLHLDPLHQLFQGEGFGNEVADQDLAVGCRVHRVEVVEDHDDRDRVAVSLQILEQLELNAARLQDQGVENCQGGASFCQDPVGFDNRLGFSDVVALLAKGFDRGLHFVPVVVDDQDLGGDRPGAI